jgi:hypothetical protein
VLPGLSGGGLIRSRLAAVWRSGPPAILLIAALGAAVGVATIYVDWPFPEKTDAFTSTGEYALWAFLFTVQTALWALALIPFLASLEELWRFGRWRRTIVITLSAAVAVAAFLAATWGAELDSPLPNHEWKLRLIVSVGAAVALVGGLGMALVHDGALRLAEAPLDDESARRAAIGEYLLLREHLQRLLAVEGAIIGAAVLTTAAMRNAILAYADKVMDKPWQFPPGTDVPTFPAEYVLIYGATFSILLALLWAPIYARLVAAGARLRADAVGEEPAPGESWLDWYGRRKQMDGVLGLEASALANFRAGVAILTPLASGLLGILFEF